MALIWRSFLTICVSILGLVSCTQEKGAEDKGKADWRLSPPVVVAGSEVLVTNAAFNSKLTPLPVTADLVFPSLTSGKAKNVKLEITSTCQSGSRTDAQTLKIQNADRIPLRSLVPIRFLSSIASQGQPDANEVLCDVEVTAWNALGSRHHFRVKDLKISGIETTHNLVALDASTEASNPPEALTSGRQGQVHLYCEKFENQRPLAKAPWKETLRELVEGPKVDDRGNGGNAPASTSTPSVDSRIEQVRQKCQLIVEAISPETGLLERWVSSPSPVRFPAPQVTIEGSLAVSEIHPGALKDISLFEAKITNPHSIPLNFSIPLLPRPTLSLRVLHVFPDYDYVFRTQIATVPLEFKLERNDQGVIENSALHFVLAPHSTVTLTARPMSGLPCEGKEDWNVPHPNNIGFYLGFSNVPQLRLNSVGLAGQLSEVDEIAWPFPIPEGNDLKLDHWQFYPTWLRNHPDAIQAPALSPGADMPLCS
jgi:hypothetical protein